MHLSSLILLLSAAYAQDRTTEQGEAQITGPSPPPRPASADPRQMQPPSACPTTMHPSDRPYPPANSPPSGPPQPSSQTIPTHLQNTRASSPRFPTFPQTVTSQIPSKETGQTLHTPLPTQTAGGLIPRAPPQRFRASPRTLPPSQRYLSRCRLDPTHTIIAGYSGIWL